MPRICFGSRLKEGIGTESESVHWIGSGRSDSDVMEAHRYMIKTIKR